MSLVAVSLMLYCLVRVFVCTTESNNAHIADVNTWHRRLGPSSKEVLSHVLKSLKCIKNCPKLNFCNDCNVAKLHQFNFTPLNTKSTAPFDLIVSDLWGPSPDILWMVIEIMCILLMILLGSLECFHLKQNQKCLLVLHASIHMLRDSLIQI